MMNGVKYLVHECLTTPQHKEAHRLLGVEQKYIYMLDVKYYNNILTIHDVASV